MSTLSESKYLKILRIFTQQELTDFEKWLNSPWCNSNKNLPILFKKIKKSAPGFEINLLDEQLFLKAFPNKKYSYHGMRNLLSESYAQAEEFLIHMHLRKKEHFKKKFLANEFQARHWEDPFFKILEKEINRLEKKAIKGWEDYRDLLELNRQAYYHPTSNSKVPSEKSIIKIDENLDLLYLSEKAIILNEKMIRNRVLKENHPIKSELKKWLEKSIDSNLPSILLFRKRFNYSDENMLKSYFEIRNYFFEEFDNLNMSEQRIHLISLLNDSIYLRKMRLLSLSDFLPLYKLGLKSQALLPHGKISRNTYIAVVTISNTCKEFEFTDEFIEKYTANLPKNIKQDALAWAKGHTANKRGLFEESLNFLLARDFRTPHFQRAGKVLTLQTYFDLFLKSSPHQSYLLSYCNSFEKWVRRDKIQSILNKNSLINFIKKCRLLVKIYSAPDFEEEKLNQALDNMKNIHAANWLLEKQKDILKLRTA